MSGVLKPISYSFQYYSQNSADDKKTNQQYSLVLYRVGVFWPDSAQWNRRGDWRLQSCILLQRMHSWPHFAFFCCSHCPFASGYTDYLAYTGVSNAHAHKECPGERVVFPVLSMRSRVTGAYPAMPSGVNAIRHSAPAQV